MCPETTQVFEVGANHKRGISATLTFLDEALCRMEEWARGKETKSVLYREENPLDETQRKAILDEIARAREVLSVLCADLDLHGRVVSAPNEIWSRCSLLWKDVVELESRYLRRYGDLSPDLAAYMDKHAPVLAQILESISAIARGEA